MDVLDSAIRDLDDACQQFQLLRQVSIKEIESHSVTVIESPNEPAIVSPPSHDFQKGVVDDNTLVEKDVLAAELKAIKVKYEKVYQRLKSQEKFNATINEKLHETQEELKRAKEQVAHGGNGKQYSSDEGIISSIHQDCDTMKTMQEKLIANLDKHSNNNFVSFIDHKFLQEQFSICNKERKELANYCKRLRETVDAQSTEKVLLKQTNAELAKIAEVGSIQFGKAVKKLEYLQGQFDKVQSELDTKNVTSRNLLEKLRTAETTVVEESKGKERLLKYNEELKERLQQLEEKTRQQEISMQQHTVQVADIEVDDQDGEKRQKRASRENQRDSLLTVAGFEGMDETFQQKKSTSIKSQIETQQENKSPVNCFYCHEPTRGLTLSCIQCKNVLHLKCLKDWSVNSKLTSPTNAKEFLCDTCMK